MIRWPAPRMYVLDAELALADAAAVRAMMAAGATRGEAMAARDDQLHDGRADLMMALAEDTVATIVTDGPSPGFRTRIGARINHIGEVLTRSGPYRRVRGGHPEWGGFGCPECALHVRRGRPIGPRAWVSCEICRVTWKPRARNPRTRMGIRHHPGCGITPYRWKGKRR